MSADPLAPVRRQLREDLRQRVDARGLATAPRTQRRVHVRDEALALLRASGAMLPQRELTRMVNEVSDEVVGFGPIEFLLQDPEVTEVMVNGPDDVYVERGGRIERAPDGLFEGEEAVMHLIERIVGPLGLRVDESSPWADARLPNGSRVHAIVPPLSLRGPVVTIRTFSRVPLTADDLVASGTMGPRMLAFLAACVRGRANVMVSGGAGSGKTTLLGVLSGFIPDDERLITIEDAAELRLAKPHVVALEARPANVEGKGQVTVRDLVRNALRGSARGSQRLRPVPAGPDQRGRARGAPRLLLERKGNIVLAERVRLRLAALEAGADATPVSEVGWDSQPPRRRRAGPRARRPGRSPPPSVGVRGSRDAGRAVIARGSRSRT